ncbi:hypothetical protein GCM10022254_01890 [Actinomadura meridiana]|uniref:Uncharacterized protein n=1 Tax=Actinomadura meridiana TaxID=559626 RepID=A0ABP8BRU3_9ACTN
MNEVSLVRELLGPLEFDRGFYPNIYVRVGDEPRCPPAELLHPMLFDPSFDRGEHLGPGRGIPETVDELTEVLQVLPVTATQMIPFLVHTCTRDLAFEALGGPWSPQVAGHVMERVMELIGPGTQWWSNVSYPE